MGSYEVIALDTGAVITLAGQRSRSQSCLLDAIALANETVVPAPVLAESLRGGPKDAPVYRILNALVKRVPTSPMAGERAGVLLGATCSTSERTLDALIVETALEHGATAIATQDPDDIRSLLRGRAKVLEL